MNQSLSTKLSLAASALALLFIASPSQADDGKKAYEANCQACHQPTGQGLAGAFPP
ncbi:cytochrome c, partial [Kangiella sp.]|uniref:c-type cytochrome n=1 Tax=Kangiella sp. TaxID=1920245 RepID=UPI001986DC45